MPGTFVDSYSKAARVYVIVPLGTPDRIQESWDTTLRHTIAAVSLVRSNKGQGFRIRELVPERLQCDPSRPSPSS